MTFIFQMALREIRASWHRLLFFFICIAIGVGSIISLRSVIQNMNTAVALEARSLLAADVEVRSDRAWSQEARSILQKHYQSPAVIGHTEVIEMVTMIRPVSEQAGVAKRIELKGVQEAFPFYGTLELSGGRAYSHDLLKDNGILVQPILLTQLGVRLGDKVKIGSQTFTIRGVIEKEPGAGMNAFSLGSRVLMDYDNVLKTGLISFGSRARHRVLLKVPENQITPLIRQLRRDLRGQLARVRSYRESQDRLSDQLTRAENYLSLIGLVVLVLGGIGISSVTRVFVQQKMKTIAILKCLGGKNRQVISTYLVQVMTLGLVGSLLGLLLAALTVWLVPKYFADWVPLDVQYRLTWQAVLQGLGIGLLIAALFSVLPLLQIRSIKPNLVLRNEIHSDKRRLDWLRLGVGLIVIACLFGLAAWQAGSLKVGLMFLGGFAATTLVLSLASALLIRLLKTVRHIPSFVLRQGVNSLYRPGNQTGIILMAVGLGGFFIIAIQSIQANLLEEFNLDLATNAPDLFFIDIQRDQRAGVEEFLSNATGQRPGLVPTIRARMVALNDKPIELERIENSRERGRLGREYVVTYRPHLEENETVIEGKLWEPTPSQEAEVSIEESLHRDFNLNVGDTITFDILGRKVTARVTSVRRVDWRNSRTGFMILFRPGALDDAPQMFITGIKGPASVQQRAQLQKGLVDRYPNISVIDVQDVVNLARSVISKITLTVSFIGGFVFLTGILILIGSIAMTKFHRIYEAAILKTLGAKKKLIIYIIVVEYGSLGLLAGFIGSAAAIGLTWAITRHVFEIDWRFAPSVNITGVVVTALLVTIVGVLSSVDVMVKKPLGILRAE